MAYTSKYAQDNLSQHGGSKTKTIVNRPGHSSKTTQSDGGVFKSKYKNGKLKSSSASYKGGDGSNIKKTTKKRGNVTVNKTTVTKNGKSYTSKTKHKSK